MKNERQNSPKEGKAPARQSSGLSREPSSSEVLYLGLVYCYARLFALEEVVRERLNLSREEIDELAQQKRQKAREVVSQLFEQLGL